MNTKMREREGGGWKAILRAGVVPAGGCKGGFSSASQAVSLLGDWDFIEPGFLQQVSAALSSFLSEALLEEKEGKKKTLHLSLNPETAEGSLLSLKVVVKS